LDNVLLVSNDEEITHYIKLNFFDKIKLDVSVARFASEARQLYIDNEYALCIINQPLPDESGENLAVDIADKNVGQVILLVNAQYFDEISLKVEEHGVITIAKPIDEMLFWNAVKIARATQKRMFSIQSENRKLLQKIEDIKIVDRAKCVLISHLTLSENEAHKYIEKHSMDMRITRRKVAEGILKTYES
jgi:two-component system, response regulator PdtaR